MPGRNDTSDGASVAFGRVGPFLLLLATLLLFTAGGAQASEILVSSSGGPAGVAEATIDADANGCREHASHEQAGPCIHAPAGSAVAFAMTSAAPDPGRCAGLHPAVAANRRGETARPHTRPPRQPHQV